MRVTEMTAEECWEVLAKTRFGRLACAHENQPYVVPIFFAADADHVYSFSVTDRKVDWMRVNPRVCLEFDSVKSWKEWTSVVAFGRYEELPDAPDWRAERQHAHSLLHERALWGQPASVDIWDPAGGAFSPVFFRIVVERLTGQRGLALSGEALPPQSGGSR